LQHPFLEDPLSRLQEENAMNIRMSRRSAAVLAAGGFIAGALLAGRALRRRRAMSFEGAVALITGGSRGLGLLIARELGREGAHVVIVARDREELERAQRDLRLEGSDATILIGDVSVEADAARVVTETIARHGQLDVLINNAGIITVGPLAHMSVDDFTASMDTHFWGPFHTVRAALPYMRATGFGRIVNISSIGGRVAVPHLSAYCASKFALTGFSNAIRSELAHDGIRVTTVCPGLMRTGSPFNAHFKGQHRNEFAWFAIADSLPLLSIDGGRAATQIVDTARYGDAELVVSWPARIAVAAAGIAPNLTAWAAEMANRLLPGEAGAGVGAAQSGWQSTSAWAPSILTRLSERAAARNNERPPVVPARVLPS
jgi:NAD(P)-dependent dehydrogenase (short-subunit alcohol dehydrogenase family)